MANIQIIKQTNILRYLKRVIVKANQINRQSNVFILWVNSLDTQYSSEITKDVYVLVTKMISIKQEIWCIVLSIKSNYLCIAQRDINSI